ncbi:MAG: MobC family plasmid mobilization relaxosome protein [Oscillospiraceae bacterium]|nr:MobC family plasmid mobilization relaxosome protein [Oscillospiraceae bacterium]
MMKKEEELKVRISAEDKERIRVKMEETGILNMSAYVRKMALDGICVKLDLEEVRQLIVLLQRCSNNLNQYAKRANETGSVYAADIEDLQSRLEEIWELSRQSLAHLANIR